MIIFKLFNFVLRCTCNLLSLMFHWCCFMRVFNLFLEVPLDTDVSETLMAERQPIGKKSGGNILDTGLHIKSIPATSHLEEPSQSESHWTSSKYVDDNEDDRSSVLVPVEDVQPPRHDRDSHDDPVTEKEEKSDWKPAKSCELKVNSYRDDCTDVSHSITVDKVHHDIGTRSVTGSR